MSQLKKIVRKGQRMLLVWNELKTSTSGKSDIAALQSNIGDGHRSVPQQFVCYFLVYLFAFSSASTRLKSLNPISMVFIVNLFPINHRLNAINIKWYFRRMYFINIFFLSTINIIIEYMLAGTSKLMLTDPPYLREFNYDLFLKSATLNDT